MARRLVGPKRRRIVPAIAYRTNEMAVAGRWNSMTAPIEAGQPKG
jgi:hypothetical protein